MKIAHWAFKNGSGLHKLAEELANAECALGHESVLVNNLDPNEWSKGLGADVSVLHSHIPDSIMPDIKKLVYCIHGTPEHVFQSSVEMGINQGYGASDPFMMAQHFLNVSDAVVTWWERSRDIWQSMCHKNAKVHYVPMGVDKEFWQPVQTRGKYAGTPSLFTAENCHYIKWPLDLFYLWPWVLKEIPTAVLHVHYLPRDQHRWFFPLINANGASYKSYISAPPLDKPELKNAFCSTDFYIGLVRYGDVNKICLEAKSCGAKVISYAGNEWADYWITEGDQRNMTKELLAILKGETQPRQSKPIPDISETAKGMIEVYESL